MRPLTLPARLPLRRVLAVARPALWINTVGTLVMGLWLTGHLWTEHPGLLVLLAYLTLPFNLLIYGLNDLADREEDALSVRKGGWQGARLTVGEGAPLLRAVLLLNVPFLLALALLLPRQPRGCCCSAWRCSPLTVCRRCASRAAPFSTA